MTDTLKIYMLASAAVIFFVIVARFYAYIRGTEYDTGLVGVMLGFSALREAVENKK